MTKCAGCGAIIQTDDPKKEGYSVKKDSLLCKRCFDIKHYNSYSVIDKNNEEIECMINEIEKTNDLVLLVTDLFSLDSLKEIKIQNPIILVFTKVDLVPRGVDIDRLLSKLKYNLNIINRLAISSKNNSNLDELYKLVMDNKRSNDVYVIGYTSSGKSTLINKFVYNYGNGQADLTTSSLPSTTLDLINVKITDDLNLIDTPGLLDMGSIILSAEANKKMFDKIIPKKEIKPVVIQVKCPQTIIIDNIFRIYVEGSGTLVFYMSNALKIERYYKKISALEKLNVNHFNNLKNDDIIIKGLGFIKVKNIDKLDLYIDEKIKISKRQSLM